MAGTPPPSIIATRNHHPSSRPTLSTSTIHHHHQYSIPLQPLPTTLKLLSRSLLHSPSFFYQREGKMMQSSFVAFCHFSWLCSKQHEMYSYPRPEMMSRRHLIGRSLAPLPSSCRDLSTVITHAAVGSSGEGTSTEMGNNTQHNSSEQNDDPSMFLELMSPIASAKPDQMSASSLAYLGDVLFELFVRSRYVWPSRRMSDLQDKVVSVVRGEQHVLCTCMHCASSDPYLLMYTNMTFQRSYNNLSAEAQSIMLQK